MPGNACCSLHPKYETGWQRTASPYELPHVWGSASTNACKLPLTACDFDSAEKRIMRIHYKGSYGIKARSIGTYAVCVYSFLWCDMIDRERLRLEMEKQGVSQAALAKAAGVSAASIQQILNGSVKSPRSVRKLADALSVSVDWLEGVSDKPNRQYLDDVSSDDVTPVPFQYLVKDTEALGENRVKSAVILFSKSWIERIAGTSEYDDIVVMGVNHADMAPTLSPGDEVILAKRQFDNHPDAIWFFSVSGDLFLRRVRRAGGEKLLISADNPAFRPFEVVGSEVIFLGLVVWHGRKMTP